MARRFTAGNRNSGNSGILILLRQCCTRQGNNSERANGFRGRQSELLPISPTTMETIFQHSACEHMISLVDGQPTWRNTFASIPKSLVFVNCERCPCSARSMSLYNIGAMCSPLGETKQTQSDCSISWLLGSSPLFPPSSGFRGEGAFYPTVGKDQKPPMLGVMWTPTHSHPVKRHQGIH